MDNNKIIIILLIVIIAILAIGMAVMFSGNLFKEDCKLNIKCNESMKKGDEIIVRLVNTNKTAIANKDIVLNLVKGNNTKKYNLTTDENGRATLKLSKLDEGNYTINCSFKGDNKYNPTSSHKKFSYKEEASASVSSVDPVDANRPVNNPKYKGYTPNHESEVLNDGWNPRQHEVSRQKNPDGTIRIQYDDNYFRICDENGYVITYGYGG